MQMESSTELTNCVVIKVNCLAAGIGPIVHHAVHDKHKQGTEGVLAISINRTLEIFF
jgi:hypothetical protein